MNTIEIVCDVGSQTEQDIMRKAEYSEWIDIAGKQYLCMSRNNIAGRVVFTLKQKLAP